MSDFGIGLQVTALGMGLVFLTLVIVMLCIMGLDRAFRPKAKGAEVEATGPALGGVTAIETTFPVQVPSEQDGHDEVAAIGLALAAAVAGRSAATRGGARARSTNPLFATMDPAETLPGEAVMVVTIDGGSGVWSRSGRLQATKTS